MTIPPRGERGAVAILVALLAVVLIGFMAFVADFGYAYSNQRRLQNGADAAVLAAGQQIVLKAPPGKSCADIKTATDGVATSAAAGAFTANVGAGATMSGGAITTSCTDAAMPGRIVVSATGVQDSAGFFGGIFGVKKLPLTKTAKVVVGPAKNVVGVRPFAVCDAKAALQNSTPDAYLTIDFSNEDLGCGTASGNFGTLDLRYPLVNGAPGSLVDGWISDGYSGKLPATSPLVLNGSPGIPANNLADDFATILDSVIVLPTYDVRSGNGSNSTYNITGYVEVQVCGVKLTSGNGSLSSGTCYDASQAPTGNNDRFVQLKFKRYMAIGELDLSCKFGDACDPDIKVSKLAD